VSAQTDLIEPDAKNSEPGSRRRAFLGAILWTVIIFCLGYTSSLVIHPTYYELVATDSTGGTKFTLYCAQCRTSWASSS